jgi:hypothetical protein
MFFSRVFAVAFCVCALSSVPPSGEIPLSEDANVVVIGDVHGDELSFLRSLWLAYNELESADMFFVDFTYHMQVEASRKEPLAKVSIHTVLVQLGDIFDRGPDGLECLELLDKIESVIGWKVVRLYGNHELMSHQGKSGPYISGEEFYKFEMKFGCPDARIKEFESAGSVWNTIVSKSVLLARVHHDKKNYKNDPEVVSSSSVNTLFVHGGIDPHWINLVVPASSSAPSLVDALNEFAYNTIMNAGGSLEDLSSLEERQSPLWIRDLAEMNSDYVCEKLLPNILRQFKVARIIVGHTPQDDFRMKSLCEARLILADASMSAWMSTPKSFAGNPAALLMRQKSGGTLSSITAVYYDPRTQSQSSEVFYESSRGGGIDSVDWFPPGQGAPPFVSHASVSTHETKPNIFPVKFLLDGIYQEIGGGVEQYNLLKALSLSAAVSGVPRILYQSPMVGTDRSFYVMLDAQGESLRFMSDYLTVRIFRQILQIIESLFSAGFYTVPPVGGDALAILDKFVFDTQSTGLVKLVDFESIKPVGSLSLETCVGAILTELARIAEINPYERLDFNFLVSQIFGADLLPSRPTPDQQSWNVDEFSIISSTQSGNVYRATFHSVSGEAKPVVVLRILPQAYQHAAPVMRFLQSQDVDWFAGIPAILATNSRHHNSIDICFDLNPNEIFLLSSIFKSFDAALASKVATQIIDLIDSLRSESIYVSLGTADSETSLKLFLSFFVFSPSRESIWLVDLSHVRFTTGAPDLLDAQFQRVLMLIQKAFPMVELKIQETNMDVEDEYIHDTAALNLI